RHGAGTRELDDLVSVLEEFQENDCIHALWTPMNATMAQYETLSTPFSMLTQRLLQVVQPFCFAEWKKLQQLGGGLDAELEIVGAHVATELVAGELC
ncbi:MAG: hypothetical protein WB556_20800, partial [Candidatus Acidiferrum sp.]